MNINKLTKEELEISGYLSRSNNNVDKYTTLLFFKYGITLTKKELAEVLKKSEQTIDRRIKECSDIPAYKRSGIGKNASYIFPIVEVSKYLSKTVKIY
ncbi:hypothetical protein [Poseidonibacter lekithochrous]|uniref:hypothetical protein n=1 Tax=Poseidonibacter lekithochrous TaxID=1904463 RepID=UPI0008FCD735|nr:hypothetical protein [Poseidonibacter lekithochrous]QKJ22317.1 hypothetical protein ALEK_1037 [Poseidonibacter lekithochrous]